MPQSKQTEPPGSQEASLARKTNLLKPDKISQIIEASIPGKSFKEPASYVEWIGSHLASRVLWFICGLAVAFAISWWLSRPTLEQARALIGTSAEAKEIVDAFSKLQAEHFDHFSRLFQLIILSGLVPIFTLLAGYAFGSRQRENNTGEK